MKLSLTAAAKTAKDKLFEAPFRQGAKYLAVGIFTFFLSGIRLLGNISPFGVAVSMALPGNYAFCAVGGALLSYGFGGGFVENIPYLVSLLCVLGVKLAIGELPRLRSNPALLCTLSGVLLAVTLAVQNALLNRGAVDMIFRLAESVLAGTITYFSFQASKLVFGKKRLKDGGTVATASLAVLGLLSLLGICGLEFSMFNVGRFLTVAALLAVSFRRGAATGAVCGLSAAAVLALHSPAFGISGGIYAVAALLSGYFSRFGRLVQAAFFMLITTIGVLLNGNSVENIRGALDMLMGSAIFLLLPQKLLWLIPATKAEGETPVPGNNRIAAKLLFTAKTLDDMQQAVEAISEKLYKSGVCDIAQVYDKTAERVCRKCGLKMFCWDTVYGETNDAFQKFTPILKEKGCVDKNELPTFFQVKCAKSGDILQTVNNYYHEFISKETASRKVLEAKQVAAEQFEGIAGMLAEFSEELSEITGMDELAAGKVRDILLELGEAPDEIYCIADQFERMRVEIYQKSTAATDYSLLTEQLSDALERQFDRPSVVTADDMTKITFFEQAQYTLDYGFSQINAGSNRVCGDCCEYFLDSKGFAHIILSDGMGSGGRAAVDSIMTCNFVLKLIKAGFGFEAALKLINSSLLVKAGEESLATLDIGCIDLYTGNMDILKAGAACSFVCRSGKTVVVEGSSLPMGILQGISYDRHNLRLQDGDVVVMVTDGAVSVNQEWIKQEIALLSAFPAPQIAQKLAALAQKNAGVPGDDITVSVARLQRLS